MCSAPSELLTSESEPDSVIGLAAPFSNINPDLRFQQSCEASYCLTTLASIIDDSYVLLWNPMALLTLKVIYNSAF